MAPMSHDVKQAIERLRRADDVMQIAVMPDVHLSAGVCVGNVVATSRLIYPQAVGSDIGCGMLAIACERDADWLRSRARSQELLAALADAVPTMRHRSRDASPALADELTPESLSHSTLSAAAMREGRVELGTLGRGNHFIEFQADDDGRLWLMIHSGSRHMGQAISAHHARHATRAGGGLHYLDAETTAGQVYLQDATWASRYAAANRRRMAESIEGCLRALDGGGLAWDTLIACDHNHVRRETHEGQLLWVHRKGAMSAREGEAGVIPGSMATRSFHVTGRGCAEALNSSAHGAGRMMSRSDARRRVSARALIRQMRDVCFDERMAMHLREESPEAYKDVDAVLRAQRDLTRVVRRLTPVLVYKGA